MKGYHRFQCHPCFQLGSVVLQDCLKKKTILRHVLITTQRSALETKGMSK